MRTRDETAHHRELIMTMTLAELDYATCAAESLLDNIACPAFLLTINCTVAHMNSWGQRAVRRKRGVTMTPAGRLVLQQRVETIKLHQLVSEAANFTLINGSSPSEFLTFTVPGELSPNSMLIYPMASPSDRSLLGRMPEPARQVLATVHYRQDSHLLREERVRTAFGFTSSESQVVLALAAGTTVSEFAEQTNRSVHTVRLHLKRALSKANCRSQAELANVLHRTIGQPI